MKSQKRTSVINEDFVKNQGRNMDENDLTDVLDSEEEINKKLAHTGMLEKYTELGKLMLNMLKDYRKGIYKQVPWFTVASVIFTLLYILNPFDIIPDFIPGLGYIDDLTVLTIAMRFVETDLHKYLDWKMES
ncbi:MAG TPA: YkvA family protein [Flavobacteriaceae bacterium]|nr:YkvA family protein [Flavobacteriaceae bacterium]